MSSENVLTPAQWEAARMLVARLSCEAQQIPFSFETLGMEWLEIEDKVCARLDDGTEVLTSDVLFAAIILLWSVLVEQSQLLEEETPLEAISRLGLGLAHADPSGSA